MEKSEPSDEPDWVFVKDVENEEDAEALVYDLANEGYLARATHTSGGATIVGHPDRDFYKIKLSESLCPGAPTGDVESQS